MIHNRISRTLIATLAAALPLLAQDGITQQKAKLVVAPDPQNVVASRLDGEWRLDVDLTKRLGGSDRVPVLSIHVTNVVVEGIPDKVVSKLQKTRIYAAGSAVLLGEEHPFLLVELKGNMQIVWFRERDGNPVGDAESMIVSVAPAREKANDLLLLGGDFNNQPFTAFQRGAATAKAAGPADAGKAGTPAEAIADIARLLRDKKHLELLQAYMTPADKLRFQDSKQGKDTLESLAEEFGAKKGGQLLELVTKLKGTEPKLNPAGDEAAYENPAGEGRGLVLVCIDGRWYIKN